MTMGELILAVNTAGTLAIGAICFFIVYTTFKGIEDSKIQEFSRRFMMAIAVLILYVSYLMTYEAFFPDSTIAQYPLYIILIFVFIYMIYAAIAFEKVAESYGISQDAKLEKMEQEEIGK